MVRAMISDSNIGYKEWAIVVDAIGRGQQILSLRKGGIHEERGQFQLQHKTFWLFPTQFHEDENSVIPSQRAALREIDARALPDAVDIEFLAVAEEVHHLADLDSIKRLQGCHIWSDHILEERFRFGHEPGLFGLLLRVYRRPQPVRLPLRESYGGCKSWIELETTIAADNLTPVLSDSEFASQRAEIAALLR